MTAFRENLAMKLFVRDAPDCADPGFLLDDSTIRQEVKRRWDQHLVMTADECVQAADAFARTACEAWGHDFRVFTPTEIGACSMRGVCPESLYGEGAIQAVNRRPHPRREPGAPAGGDRPAEGGGSARRERIAGGGPRHATCYIAICPRWAFRNRFGKGDTEP